jgi:prepilin-type N-terminal cleavage/methylation domain-containing protein
MSRAESPGLPAGFSLIEVLVVLSIIAAISSAILPNLGLSTGSQMSLALRDLSTNLRATYDSAVLSGRIHRLVIHPTTSEYWAEQAPLGYEGRPPVATSEDSSATAGFNADARARLLEDLEKALSDPRRSTKASQSDERFYSTRSMLVQQRTALKPLKWSEVDDAVLYKRSLPGDVVFVNTVTDAMKNKLEFQQAGEKDFAYIYFFPSGEVQQAAVQLGLRTGEKEVNMEGPKFTLFLDPLSGHSELVEGFQEPEFLKDAK